MMRKGACRTPSSGSSSLGKRCQTLIKMFVLVQRSALLAVILAVTVVQAQNASDAPSEVPSMLPSTIVSESQLPTIIPSNDNGGQNVTVPTGTCNEVGGCTSFSTLPELAGYLASVNGQSKLCLCPVVYTNENGACGATPDEPSVSVSPGQDLTIECDDFLGAKCIFACEAVAFSVSDGGKLTLRGNNLMEFTWGRIYSRLVIESGGAATVNQVVFRDTFADTSYLRRLVKGSRRLQSPGNGVGGAIANAGSLNVDESSFSNCSAFFQGGGIYISGNATVLNSKFYNNTAQAGGAIYVDEGGSLTAQSNAFEGNAGTVESNEVGTAPGSQVSLCGNAGIEGSQPCEGTTSAAGVSSPIHQVGTILTWAILFVCYV